jgi:hypothetical protein
MIKMLGRNLIYKYKERRMSACFICWTAQMGSRMDCNGVAHTLLCVGG